MVSVIFLTPETLAARPIPGKIYMLLHCDGTSVLLLDNVTGAKGLPVATYESIPVTSGLPNQMISLLVRTIARPSVAL
jgi:hypothetical protein